MKRLVAVALLMTSFSNVFGASTSNSVTITPQVVSNLAAKADTLAMAGDVAAYAELLADDFQASHKHDGTTGPITAQYTKQSYLDGMRQTLANCRTTACKTNIEKCEISPTGDRAVVESICLSQMSAKAIKQTISIVSKETVVIELRNGVPLLIRLDSEVTDMVVK